MLNGFLKPDGELPEMVEILRLHGETYLQCNIHINSYFHYVNIFALYLDLPSKS